MNLENTTETLCDQLKKFVAEQMEEKRMLEKRMQERGEIVLKVLAIIGLVILSIAVLTALGFRIRFLWRSRKSRRAGPVTKIPKTPISNKDLSEWSLHKIDGARVFYGSVSHDGNRCYKKLEEILRMVFNLNSTPFLAHNTRVISIRMDGFKDGAEFHDFEPADGVISGSHFTYQMFGDDTIQVTRYVVGNKSYVAGFCIYIKNDSVEDIEINMDVIKKLMKEAKYPGKEAVEKEVKEELEKMKAGKTTIPSKFAFWKRTQQNDVPPRYSSLSVA